MSKHEAISQNYIRFCTKATSKLWLRSQITIIRVNLSYRWWSWSLPQRFANYDLKYSHIYSYEHCIVYTKSKRETWMKNLPTIVREFDAWLRMVEEAPIYEKSERFTKPKMANVLYGQLYVWVVWRVFLFLNILNFFNSPPQVTLSFLKTPCVFDLFHQKGKNRYYSLLKFVWILIFFCLTTNLFVSLLNKNAFIRVSFAI